ncbi:MAG: hypothetical protein HYZ50_10125 [Deltaproteobacteria bacterium]|nr:hypothetical protein [Deltaproteobacteria bacterium]
MDFSKFEEIGFEWNEGNLAEIEGHDIGDWECEECFFNDQQVYRNKRKQRPYPTYRLVGRTDAGRELSVIFFVSERHRTEIRRTAAVVRIITAWPME